MLMLASLPHQLSKIGLIMLKYIISTACTALMCVAGGAFAAGGAGKVEDTQFSFEGPFGTFDQEQLRRGLKVYTEVCCCVSWIEVCANSYSCGRKWPWLFG
jgi:cytochrome c1